jgi:hypothetical protein
MKILRKLKLFSLLALTIFLIQNIACRPGGNQFPGTGSSYRNFIPELIFLQIEKSGNHYLPFKLMSFTNDFKITGIREFLFKYFRMYRRFLCTGANLYNPFYLNTTINAP